MKHSALSILVVLLFAGCGGKSSDPDSGSASDTAATERETVFDPLTDTLDRARSVEDTVFDQAAEQRRQIDEQTSGR